MKFIPQIIPDVLLIEPVIHDDERGYFLESFRSDIFARETGKNIHFIQDNESRSSRGVLRGLHFQLPPHTQSKLVRVIQGSVLDVAVDIRTGSPTFGQHTAIELNDVNKYQLFIPRGFAHGFVVLSETAIFTYKVDNFYSPQHDRGLAWNDPALAIDWKMDPALIQLPARDQQHPSLAQIGNLFSFPENQQETDSSNA